MPSALVRALRERHGLPVVDTATIDAFLAPAEGEAEHALLFFTGDPKQRLESDDVAVVLPALVEAFGGRVRAAVVAREAEEALKSRFQVVVMPSLALTRRGETLAVLPKIKDWAEYLAKIGAALAPDALALKAGAGPRTEFQFSGQRGLS
ncbi:MAG: hydrogenase accessory protein [Roseiarcus sp.]